MCSFGQFLRHYLAALTAFLCCVCGINELHCSTGAFCLVLQNADKAGPASIGDTATQSATLEYLVDVQVFRSNEAVARHQLMSSFVVHVTPCVGDTFMQPRNSRFYFLSAITSFLAARQGSLYNSQFLQASMQDFGVTQRFSATCRNERFQPKVDSCFTS